MLGPAARDLQSTGLQHVHSAVAGRRPGPESSSLGDEGVVDPALDVGVVASALHDSLSE